MSGAVIRHFTYILLLISFYCIPFSWAGPHPNVLILNSYHQGFQWKDQITTGITSVLNPPGRANSTQIQPYIEDMDAIRITKQNYFQELADINGLKYAKTSFNDERIRYKTTVYILSAGLLVLALITFLLILKILKYRKTDRQFRRDRSALEENFQKQARELENTKKQMLSELADRKSMEQHLVESEKRYRDLYEGSRDGFARVNMDGIFIESNSSFQKMTGYTEQDLQALTFMDITPPKWHAIEASIIRDAVLTRGFSDLYEKEYICKNKEIVQVEIRVHLLTGQNAQPEGMWAFIRDIKDRKRSEMFLEQAYAELENRIADRTEALVRSNEALRAAKEAADASTQAKSNFLANMSHEIRTPMNGVIAAADLALAEDLPAKARHFLNIIHSSAYSLLSIINDILDFSKIEAGKLDLENAPFYLDDVLTQITDMFVSKAVEKRIELLVDIDPGVPKAVIGDALRLQQILTNLVGNAIKFTGKGGIIYIGIELSQNNLNSDQLQANESLVPLSVKVKDNGIGISLENQAVLFDAFSQADNSTTRKFGGTGLGLCICKRLVEMMGGGIGVESVLGEGSTFYFNILLKKQPHHIERRITIPPEIEGLHILIVDDSQANRELMQKVLQTFGFCTYLAASGEEAIATVKKRQQLDEPLDLIIMDWMMPGMDGLEASDQIINGLDAAIPIIMFTSVGKETEKQIAEELGIQAFLYKPINPAMLFEVILEIFGEKPQKEAPHAKKISTKASIYKKRLKGLRILVAEDNFTNQEIARAVLEGAGIIVEIAVNGKQAIEALLQSKFDAVLMDMQMPEMDGYEATQAIRQIPAYASLPIIAMTAHAMKGDDEKCIKAGMNGYITKPISQDILFHTLWKNVIADEDTSLDQTASTEHPSREPTESDPSSILPPSLAGIDIQTVLEALNIPPDSFKRILLGFLKNNRKTAETLSDAFVQKDWGGLKALAHSIKGSSANIGAYDLQKAAKTLEYASRNGEESGEPLARELVDDTVRNLEIVLQSISQLASENKTTENSKATAEAAASMLPTVLKQFEGAILQANPSDILKHLDYLKKQANLPEIESLEDQIAAYDYDEALETLRKIMDGLPKTA